TCLRTPISGAVHGRVRGLPLSLAPDGPSITRRLQKRRRPPSPEHTRALEPATKTWPSFPVRASSADCRRGSRRVRRRRDVSTHEPLPCDPSADVVMTAVRFFSAEMTEEFCPLQCVGVLVIVLVSPFPPVSLPITCAVATLNVSTGLRR